MTSAIARVAVLKFGGTSVATREQREAAFARILDAREAGYAPVAIVSAMGRSPSPYATDTLLELIGGDTGSANADLLLACGELIAAAVFAEELRAMNVEAQAMTGAQAGIVTDGTHSDAKILRVEPHAVNELLARGAVPVIAGFQGTTARSPRLVAAAATSRRLRLAMRSARIVSTFTPTSAVR
jgi:aspartate kinase